MSGVGDRANDPELKRYIGDGVYAHWDGWQIWLTTLEGHQIALEPQVFAALLGYKRDLVDYLRLQQAAGEAGVEDPR